MGWDGDVLPPYHQIPELIDRNLSKMAPPALSPPAAGSPPVGGQPAPIQSGCSSPCTIGICFVLLLGVSSAAAHHAGERMILP